MHTCPTCGQACCCNGDIDDILFDEDGTAYENCTCCPDDGGDDEYDDWPYDDVEETVNPNGKREQPDTAERLAPKGE